MERENFPRYARDPFEMDVDVEHERGIWMVKATFRHEEVSHLTAECVGYARRGLFGRYLRRDRVRLRSQGRTTRDSAAPYLLERMRVHTGKHGVYDVNPPPPLGFYLEQEPGHPGLPAHERNARRFSQGDEVSLEVRASHPYGVKTVTMRARRGSYPTDSIHLRGEGDGGEECRVRLTGRVGDTKLVGRYRATEMEIYPPDLLIRASSDGRRRRKEPLHPPLVFDVVKKEVAPPPPEGATPEEPEGPNWGFSG